jgi:hypothetical protein
VTVSIGTIAQQALRRLGVRIVPLDDSPVLTETVATAIIATQALVELGVIAPDETPSQYDLDLTSDKLASVHAALDAQGVVWWTVYEIPRGFTEEYVKLTAAMSASSFGKTVDPTIVALLEGRIRKGAMVLSADDNANQAVQAVHDYLVMRGVARGTVFDIPDAVGNQYAVLAADRLAPLFGMETDPKDAALAMISIYRFVALPSSGETVAAAYF